MVGQRVGKLVVIKEVDKLVLPSGQTNRAFLCKCDCGEEKVVRKVHLSKDEFGNVYNPKEVKINIFKNSNGYLCFTVRKNNALFKVFAHRLQAYQSYGNIIFNDDIVVRHLNGNKLDNSRKNIGFGTHQDNMMDIAPEVRKEKAIKASRIYQNSRRSKEVRFKIYEDLKNKVPYSKISKKYQVPKSTLSFMKNFSEEAKDYLRV